MTTLTITSSSPRAIISTSASNGASSVLTSSVPTSYQPSQNLGDGKS